MSGPQTFRRVRIDSSYCQPLTCDLRLDLKVSGRPDKTGHFLLRNYCPKARQPLNSGTHGVAVMLLQPEADSQVRARESSAGSFLLVDTHLLPD